MPKIEKPEIKWDQKSLAALRPGPVTWTFSDATTPGLTLRITKAGAKTYFYTYRMGGRGTKEKWLKLGAFGALPLVRAREKAREYRTQRDHGIDPAVALLEAAHRGSTLDQAWARFGREYAPKNLSDKSWSDYQDSYRKHIGPKLGSIPIQDLTRDQVDAWHAGIPDKAGRGQVAANRALAALSCLCTQAELWKLRAEGANPCKHVTRYEETPRARDIENHELADLAGAWKKMQGAGASPWVLGAIQVVALCNGRISEVLALKRGRDMHLDDPVGAWALIRQHKGKKKAGAKRLEIPAPAAAILSTLPRVEDNPHFFPGRIQGSHLTRGAFRTGWLKLQELAGVEDLHVHDLRSRAASEAEAQGISPKTGSQLLGNTPETTMKHYARVRPKGSAEAASKVAAPVARAFGLEVDPAKARARRLVKRAVQRLKG